MSQTDDTLIEAFQKGDEFAFRGSLPQLVGERANPTVRRSSGPIYMAET